MQKNIIIYFAYIPRFNAKKTNVNRNVPCAPILQRQYMPSATILSVGDCRSAYSSDHQSFSLSLSLSHPSTTHPRTHTGKWREKYMVCIMQPIKDLPPHFPAISVACASNAFLLLLSMIGLKLMARPSACVCCVCVCVCVFSWYVSACVVCVCERE